MRKLFILIAMLAMQAAQAGVTIYTDQSQFLAANPLNGADSFDDLTAGLTDGPLSRNAGAFSYSASIEHTQDFFPLLLSGADVALSTSQAASTVVFDHFSSGVRGIGGQFFGTDFSGAAKPGASLRLLLTDASGTFEYWINSAGFLGLVSDSRIYSLTVSAAQIGGDIWPTINQLTVSAVPEPSAYALLAAGLLMLGCAAYRRKQGSV